MSQMAHVTGARSAVRQGSASSLLLPSSTAGCAGSRKGARTRAVRGDVSHSSERSDPPSLTSMKCTSVMLLGTRGAGSEKGETPCGMGGRRKGGDRWGVDHPCGQSDCDRHVALGDDPEVRRGRGDL